MRVAARLVELRETCAQIVTGAEEESADDMPAVRIQSSKPPGNPQRHSTRTASPARSARTMISRAEPGTS